MTTRPGTWERVRTNAGYHARLVGANGETVLTSEVYPDPDTATEAIALAARTGRATVFANDDEPMFTDVDERGAGL